MIERIFLLALMSAQIFQDSRTRHLLVKLHSQPDVKDSLQEPPELAFPEIAKMLMKTRRTSGLRALETGKQNCGECPNELPPGWNYEECPGDCNSYADYPEIKFKDCESKLDLTPDCFLNSDDFEKYSNDYVKDWCKCTCEICGNSTSTFPPQGSEKCEDDNAQLKSDMQHLQQFLALDWIGAEDELLSENLDDITCSSFHNSAIWDIELLNSGSFKGDRKSRYCLELATLLQVESYEQLAERFPCRETCGFCGFGMDFRWKEFQEISAMNY